jgi:hypothetical protein
MRAFGWWICLLAGAAPNSHTMCGIACRIAAPAHIAKGHSKINLTDLDAVGWFLGGQKSTRVEYYFGKYLLGCF